MEPVTAPLVTVGMDARLALAESRSALLKANDHLICSKGWYQSVRGRYSK